MECCLQMGASVLLWFAGMQLDPPLQAARPSELYCCAQAVGMIDERTFFVIRTLTSVRVEART
jgi:hypothetical protein